MLMKIDQAMESGGSSGDDMASPPSRGSLSPMALPLSNRGSKNSYSPPLDRNSPLGPPTSLAAHHMINSIAASSAAKNMTPGILASLSLSLNAMSSAAAASFHHHDFGGGNATFVGDRGLDRHPYGSPPAPVAPSNDPTANECKLVDYRGQKVAAFVISGETMLCLPQAFELFLKHLVGGLHTVYTKLKRLDIVPIVCNVEQVRILRGLGAIQPGVNRCKLLSCKDFDVLYKDCTTARQTSHSATTTTATAPSTTAPLWSRIHSNNGERVPGRPPKRTSVPLVGLSAHGGPSHYMMKKHRLENGDYSPYDHAHHNPADMMRLEKSPLLANGYNHPPTQLPPMHLLPLAGQSAAAVAAAHAALFSPSGIPLPPGHPRDCRSAPIQSLDAARNATWETCRTAYEDFVKQFESRYHEECSDSEKSSHANEAGSGEGFTQNGNLEGASPVLNLSKNTTNTASDSEENGDEEDDEDYSDNERRSVNKFTSDGRSSKSTGVERRSKSPPDGISAPQQQAQAHTHDSHSSSHHHCAEVSAAEAAISSTENLLRNIQGLLKVAADNAKQQERRVNLEKSEFKMEIMRERELREQLEKQLIEERNLRIYYEKRWKKERRFRKKLEDTQEETSSESASHNQQQHSMHPYHSQQQSLLNNNEKCPPSENAKSHHHQQNNNNSPSAPSGASNNVSATTAPSTNGSLKADSSDR